MNETQWNNAEWTRVWGGNAPTVVNTDDGDLPQLPERHTWLVTRDILAGRRAYQVALLHRGADPTEFRVLGREVVHDKLDVRQCAQAMLENHLGY